MKTKLLAAASGASQKPEPRRVRIVRQWVAALVLVLLTLPAALQAADFTYTTTNGAITITRYTGPGGAVTIPDRLPDTNGLPVTTIGDYTFVSCTNLTSVTIPSSVSSIGEAFNFCYSLSSITVDPLNSAYSSLEGVLFNQSQTTLIRCPAGKAGAFTIPDSVTNLGAYAFYSCTSLTSITVDPLNSAYSSLEGVLFNQSQTTLIQCPGGKAGAYTVPSGVTSIGDDAFRNCTRLSNITISSGVTNIGYYAFRNCTSLTSITVDPLNSAYSSLEGVVFNQSQTTLIQCPAGKAGAYTIPDSVTNLGANAFDSCTSLSNITIPSSVTTIGNYAFDSCTSLTSITIPSSVTSIGDGAFYFCGSLSSVTIPNSVTNIGDYAFYFCYSLSSVTVPSSVTSIREAAFYHCTSLTNVTISSGVTSIRAWAFFYCTSLRSITIPNSVTNIGDIAFYTCTSLSSITISSSVTSIGNYTFSECTSLSSITIPSSVTSIGNDAFSYCTSLSNITIPSSVTLIGKGAFSQCTLLTRAYFQGNAPTLGSSFFFLDAANAIIYYLPGTTGWGATFGHRPTAQWLLPYPLILNHSPSFGIQTNQFGFIISWATNLSVVVDTSTDLVNPTWLPLQTNTLTAGVVAFIDPDWTNSPRRFYRVRWP